MCDKLYYCGCRIDPCLINEINQINEEKEYKTILCCCGHDKYPKTIVVQNLKTKEVIECIHLNQGLRKPKRYYKKDDKGYYYIPEVIKKKEENL